MNVILLNSNQQYVSVTYVPSTVWWEHESK